jgi:hypothetical protein
MKTKFNSLSPRLAISVSLAVSVLAFAACGGGSDDEGIGTDACSLLSSRAKIIDGTQCEAKPSSVFRISIDGYSCSGTLITPSQILTAAHCVFKLDQDSVDLDRPIEADKLAIFAAESEIPSALVTKVTAHPDFKRDVLRLEADYGDELQDFVNGVLTTGFADIAILDLDRSLSVAPQPITNAAPAIGSNVGIFGYGATDGDNIAASSALSSGRMLVEQVGPDNFSSIFRDGGSNTCFGDSGGPALRSSGTPAILGTTALGSTTNCARNEVTLFTLLSSARLRNFITTVAPSAAFQ